MRNLPTPSTLDLPTPSTLDLPMPSTLDLPMLQLPIVDLPLLDLPTPTLRQCAWCLLVADQTGRYTIHPGRKIKTATHGICPTCKEVLRAEIDATPVLLAA